jgi:fatty-acyl-CoA synthase
MERVKQTPYKTVIVIDNKEINWNELKILSDIVALEFLEKGISKGTHVGIFSENSLQWILSYLALTRIGALPVLINYNYKKNELEEVLRYADIEYLLYGDGFKDTNLIDQIKEINFDDFEKFQKYLNIGSKKLKIWELKITDDLNTHYLEILEAGVYTHDHLNLIFTSGTISKVKGIILSHYQMLNISMLQAKNLHWNDSDIVCLPLPFFHCFGLSCGILAALNVNLKLCLATTRSSSILKTIQENKCTVLNGVPSMFNALMNNDDFKKFDISSLKSGIIAGSRVGQKDFVKISQNCHIPYLQQSYGQTEASPAITFTSFNESLNERSLTVGKVIDNIELRIFDNKNLKTIDNGIIGEIQVRGFNVIKSGYYNLKEESENLYTKDGWLKTGDIGFLDEKDNLHVTGRIKEMIIKCGENISPYEIEEVIMSYKGIIQVKVLGIPDKFAGEKIVAVYKSNSICQQENLHAFLKGKISDYKLPECYIRIEKFPLRENGKINTKEIDRIVFKKLRGGESDGIKSTTKIN